MNQKGFAPVVLILMISVLVLVGGGIYYQQVNSPPTPSESPSMAQNSSHKTFANPVYKYKFDYPATYTIKMTNENFIDVLTDGGMEYLTIWAESDLSDGSTTNINFSSFAILRAGLLCAEDGSTSTYCDEKPIKQIPFVTNSGIQGYELYLKETDEQHNVALTKGPVRAEIRTIGPIFVLNVSKQTSSEIRILIIAGESSAETPSDKANQIRNLVKTIRF